MAIWNVDFSAMYGGLQGLRKSGVENLSQHFENQPHLIQTLAEKVNLCDVNEVTLALFDASSKQHFKQGLRHIMGGGANEVFLRFLLAIWERQKVFRAEVSFFTLDGEAINTIV